MTTDDAPLLSAAPNFRDLGGYATHDGRTVRRGVLYRSDALTGAADGGLGGLDRLGLRQLVDLRTPHERERAPDLVPDSAEYAPVRVQADTALGANLSGALGDPQLALALLADNGAERFMHAVYRELVTDAAALSGYGELVERAAHGPTALVFHCTAGKDRTGWGAAVLLTLLGVPRATVVEDYLLSNSRQANAERWMRGLIRGTGIGWELVAPMARVRSAYLETAFTEVERVFGSFEGYVRDGLGAGSTTVSALRSRML